MGCSSSSAQTVDQEKRPGTKPEETNGDTLMVQNGVIAEDAETIKEQIQLPVQGSTPDDSSPGDAKEEAAEEAVLAASEAQEDPAPVEELVTNSEQQVSVVSEESTPSATPADPVEAETKTVSSEVEVSPVEPFQAEEPQEVEAQETPAEVPAVDTVVQLKKESSDVNEPVAAESAEASPVVEGVEKVDDNAETDVLAPISAPAEPPSEPEEHADQAVSSAPEEAKELLIDAQLAKATIPEIPPVSPAQPQDQAQSSAEEAAETPAAPTASTKEDDSAPEPAESNQEEELPASTVMVPVISTEVVPDSETPVITLKDSEDSSASTSGVDSTPELSSEGVSSTQASLDKVKKED